MPRSKPFCPQIAIDEVILDDIVVKSTTTPTPLSSARRRRSRTSSGGRESRFAEAARIPPLSFKEKGSGIKWRWWIILTMVAVVILVRETLWDVCAGVIYI